MLEHISKFDPSRRISLSPQIAEYLGLKIGDYVRIAEEKDGKLVLYKVVMHFTSGVEPKVQGEVIVIDDKDKKTIETRKNE